MIEVKDSLLFLQDQDDYSADIIYSDPPYALGSEITIRPDGKVDYAKASDFMNKWDMPTGDWWSDWFDEAFRTLKHGGYCIMFGLDRQLLTFKYYAHLAGFTEKQSLYWYFISNFPKATDLSKMIDKNAGADREKLGEYSAAHQSGSENWSGKDRTNGKGSGYKDVATITAPSTPLAQKYSGYKYSIAPLKQTNETIMVFQKPYKTGSCLHDTLAFENGDESITVGALNIDGNRVGTEQVKTQGGDKFPNNYGTFNTCKETTHSGRYPSQTFCDSSAAEVLDRQSGVKTGKRAVMTSKPGDLYGGGKGLPSHTGEYGFDDTGGCSKILHKCDFEKDEHDIYFYQPKVSKSERNAGLDGFEEKERSSMDGGRLGDDDRFRTQPATNNHPTLKPIALNEKILRLFKTPNDQKILFPFGGSGSEIIGGIKAGFTNWQACELNPEYVEIAKARIDYWTNISHTSLKPKSSAKKAEDIQQTAESLTLF